MNILFITAPEPPNLFHRIRALNLIKYLGRDHAVHLVSLTGNQHPNSDGLRPWCNESRLVYQPKWRALVNCLRSIATLTPLEVAYCTSKGMNDAVKTILKKSPIDLIYIKRLRSIQFVPPDTTVPCIVDTTDAMSWYYRQAKRAVPWYRKPLFYHEARTYRDYERQLLKRFPYWVVCSPLDAEYLKTMAPPEAKFWVIPNGVDTEYFRPITRVPETNTILFSGLMDKFVNVQAAIFLVKEILPHITRAVPNVVVYLVGPKPSVSVRRLASQNVKVIGVAPDLREYLARGQVVACPVQTGVGTRNKILQAWAVGRPVVTTTKGLEGLEGANERDVLCADTAMDFARQTVRLLQDAALRQRLAENGLALVRERYAMEIIIQRVNELLETVRRMKPRAD
ncbi:MAG: glycosyltransferase family 4 protein [Patescibacteria group bacterium]|nr:glycosyltransferase family 4 protein [Patescibacteria group bacterium]